MGRWNGFVWEISQEYLISSPITLPENLMKYLELEIDNKTNKKQAGPGLYGPAPSLAYGMRL